MNQTFSGGGTMAEYLLATYGVFGVVGAALFSFGVGVATERGQGWLQVKRASPMPPAAYFLAKVFTCLVFALAIAGCLFALAATAGGVRLAPGGWVLLAGLLVGGAIPFCAFGLALGTLCGPNSAPAVVNLIYLPMSFASGLWIPLRALPDFFQNVAPWLPPYHLAQLALKVVGFDEGGSLPVHLGALAAWTVVSLAIAVVAFRSSDDRTWG
jgi:ABC-2 type transport system permease protein